jgi:glucose/arabinose dehydrogenase
MMVSKLILSALTMTAVLAVPQAFAQGIPTQPASNQTAKQARSAATVAPKAGPTRAEKKPATVKAKPAETGATAPQQTAANPRAGKEVPRIQSDPLGRVSVDKQGSTFGFSSDTKMKAYETPDGQRIRGMDHAITTSRQPSYFGLSLSVPTTGTSSGDGLPGLFPVPPRN